jgi:GNAT superfamily N-acetyltransferase
MFVVTVRDMDISDEYFVGTCSHMDESEEIDACAERRIAWLRAKYEAGLRVKVATVNGERAGVLYVMPIEVCPWGPFGRDLLVIPCLFVRSQRKGKGVGRALVVEAERETRRQKKKGLAGEGYYHDFCFMPVLLFEECGFEVAKREGKAAILWKVYNESAEAPRFLEPRNQFELMPGRVMIDLFWNRFCQTSDIEAQREREVVEEFGNRVILREYDAGDQEVLRCYRRVRGIFVNGEETGWGYEAPREGIREAIARALEGG